MPKMTKPFDLRNSATKAARRTMRKLLDATAADLRDASAGAGVHAARRNIKRLRSLLRLVRPGIGAAVHRSSDRHLKDAAGLLAGARRVEAFDAVLAKLRMDVAARAAARSQLQRMSGKLVTLDVLCSAASQALTHVDQVRLDLKRWRLPKSDRSFCIAGLRQSYRLARRKLAAALNSGDADALHESRKHVIHNLHHLEMLRGLWPEVMPSVVAELTVLREALGEINDLNEMTSAMHGFDATDLTLLPEIHAAIAELRATHIAAARNKAGKLYAEKPAAFAKRIDAMWRAAAE